MYEQNTTQYYNEMFWHSVHLENEIYTRERVKKYPIILLGQNRRGSVGIRVGMTHQ